MCVHCYGIAACPGFSCARGCSFVRSIAVAIALCGAVHVAYGQVPDVSGKGSLLVFPKFELRWDSGGTLLQDTVFTLVNDTSTGVIVQTYVANGDAPVPGVEPGWNWIDCQFQLAANEPTYMSAATGLPLGCAPFWVLDPDLGDGLGRPDPEVPGERMLRGHMIAWAVNQNGNEIDWDHLFGSAVTVNYSVTEAWEYEAYAFKAVAAVVPGSELLMPFGRLDLDGVEFQAPYDKLYLDFFASGSQAFSGTVATALHDTDLTILPMDMDLRQDNDGPTSTKAQFSIWSQAQSLLTGTQRCVTFWDETSLSAYSVPNYFLLGSLQSDRGRAQIEGVTDAACDGPNASSNAALLAVASKRIAFSGGGGGVGLGGRALAGSGAQSATIQIDIPAPPDPLALETEPLREAAGVPSNVAKVNGRGSLLIFPDVELKWNAAGELIENTFIELSNTASTSVRIRLQFINGDAPVDAVYAGNPPQLVVEAEPGWNSACCEITLGPNQPVYWSASSGPGSCAPFTALDLPSEFSTVPGRPDPETGNTTRVLRGYILAWAVGADGGEVSWNHLTGGITHVNYERGYIWEHSPYAFAALSGSDGSPPDGMPGQLLLNGVEFDRPFAFLQFPVFASGSQALSSGANIATADTDLTVLPVSGDLRNENTDPVASRATYSVWNQNSSFLSGTARCVTCWDQTLQSAFGAPNRFLLANLATNMGKARVSGLANVSCDSEFIVSTDAALAGARNLLLAFSGGATGFGAAGTTLTGSASDDAVILFDPLPNCGRIYVDSQATGAESGTSWADAFEYLRDALAVASAGMEVWVAAGTYKPTLKSCITAADCGGAPNTCPSGLCVWNQPRQQAFQLPDGVSLYGGFQGDEILLSQRDVEANATILSGDVLGNDGPGFVNNAENNLHVLRAESISAVTLDGFEITGGNADIMSTPDDIAGGLLVNNAAPVIANCRFRNNSALGPGGGIGTGSSGQLTVTDCTFAGNRSTLIGGAAIYTAIDTTITGGDFESNDGPNGGAILVTNSVVLDLDTCRFAGNTAFTAGAAISTSSGATVQARRCSFVGNSSRFGGAIEETDAITPSRYVSCFFAGNHADDFGGAVYIDSTNPEFNGCAFSANSADDGGGAVYSEFSAFEATNCTFYANSSLGGAGGLQVDFFNPVVTNSVLWANTGVGTVEGQQVTSDGGSPSVNYSIVQGLSGALGGMGNVGSNPAVSDADGPDNVAGTLDDDLRLRPGSPAIDAGNTTSLPQDTLDLDGDMNTTEFTPFDLAGRPRQFDDPATPDTGVPGSPVVDIGAYEFFTDCNNNNVLDATDIVLGDSQDCDSPNWTANGIPDECDIQDCSANPNCDDCNLNGMPDACDIDAGTSMDVDLPLGVPDECIAPDVGVNWSDDIWNLVAPDPYPDNLNPNAVPGLHVSLPTGLDLFLDVTVEIDSLRLQSGSILRVTQSGEGDLRIAPPGNLQLGGTLLVANDREVSVPAGTVSVVPGGIYRGNPGALSAARIQGGTVTAALDAVGLDLTYPSCEPPGCTDGGAMCLSDEMSLTVTGDVKIDGRLAVDAICGMSETVCAAGPRPAGTGGESAAVGGYTPPILSARFGANVYVTGNVSVLGLGELVIEPLTPGATPLALGGDFVNESTNPACFNVSVGGIELNGTGLQTFEAASTDVGEAGGRGGSEDNFGIGTISVTAGTPENQHTVVFADAFDNNALGQGSCEEAVYVSVLTLEANTHIILDNCRLYADTVVADPTAVIAARGCGALVGVPVPSPPPLTSEPGAVNDGRMAAVVVPPPVFDRGPAQNTALRVVLTTLNHPRQCCAGQVGNGFGTGCNGNTSCDTDANCSGGTPLCRHTLAAGVPDYSAFEGKVRYVNSFTFPAVGGSLNCPDDGPPFNTSYKCATLGCEPEYRDWATDLAAPGAGQPQVPGLLYISGDAVVPSSILEVSQIADTCGAAATANTCPEASAALPVRTARWGDITGAAFSPPDGKADVLDIPAVVNKLKGVATLFPEYRVWLKQRDPVPQNDAITVVDLSDVQDCVLARPYPASRTIDACPHD